ncbi:hypothetical protein [Variovorax sp. CCNWLW235]|uniref:hypothetical protein n=1 Tax=Variovorax sp. CCNWLW235 TaxID=3127463 RepID=UPI003077DF74
MRKIIMCGLGFSFALITACGTVGGNSSIESATTQSLSQSLKTGVTTTDDVKRLFGNPDYVKDSNDGSAYWSYGGGRNSQKRAIASLASIPYLSTIDDINTASGAKRKSLSLYFNSNKKLTSYSLSSS